MASMNENSRGSDFNLRFQEMGIYIMISKSYKTESIKNNDARPMVTPSDVLFGVRVFFSCKMPDHMLTEIYLTLRLRPCSAP
jgi:hypothetical protein